MVSMKDTLERIAMATFGLAWAGCDLGRPDAWLPAAVGIAGLIGVVVSDFAKAGPESKRKLEKIRHRVKTDIDSKVPDYKTQLQINDVDGVLGDELLKCFLDREALVQAAADPSGFPVKATELVMAALADRRSDLFGDAAPQEGREYAKRVISTALWAAVEDRAYFENIQARLTFAQSREIARILESNGRVEAAMKRVEGVATQTQQTVELARAESSESHKRIETLIVSGDEESRARFQEILAILQAQRAAGISPNPNPRDRRAIEDALTSPDPERRRTAYLARGILNLARAAHEFVLETRQLRPTATGVQQVNDKFADYMFEGDLLRAEGKLDDAIKSYQWAIAVKRNENQSDGLAVVALANALMDRGMLPSPDGGEWDADSADWGASYHFAGEILLPILEAGYGPSNPAYLPAVWAYAHWWFHFTGLGLDPTNAALTSTRALLSAEKCEPNNPITLRLLGRNAYKFEPDPRSAEPYFKRAIESDPADVKHKFYYGLYLTDLPNRADDAAAQFEQCLAMEPDNPHVLEAFAFLLSINPGDAARAEIMWRHSLRIWPGHAVGWKRYGRFLALSLDYERAEEVFKKGLTQRPKDGSLWCEYAVLLEEQPGREGDAISAYDRVLTLSPNAVEPNVRSVMMQILAGVFTEPETAGLKMTNEGLARDDARLVAAGGWLGVLYARPSEQKEALTLLKALKDHFGKSLEFLCQGRCIAQAIASGNRFAPWLDPLSRVIAGMSPLSALDSWDAWMIA